MTLRLRLLARLALGGLWIFTGITSAFIAPEIGYEVLAQGNVTGNNATTLVYLASGLDILIGLWALCDWRPKLCCVVQLVVITGYSALLSFFAPEYWLHPFGPLTKNIPIAVLIYILYSDSASSGFGRFSA